ncbi:MAG: DUF2167 domain-containing protein [Kiloniellales bacterium]|nr:DUF2167 domain-containing protein [Kiloniellales bacterium]
MFQRPALILFLAAAAASPATAQSDPVEDLHWQSQRLVYEIPGSKSSYDLGPNERIVVGAQARRFLELTQGIDGWPDVVALIESTGGPAAGSFIDIEYHEIGFLEDEDWKDVAPDSLLQEIIDGTRDSNPIRAENGYPTLEVLGWAEEPHYNARNNTVYWATRLRDSEGIEAINAIALKLGRHGYSRLTWTGDPEQFQNAKMALGPALTSYDYQEGARYADFRAGDAVAAVGLGALAVGMMTGNKKAWGAGILAGALVLLKKFWYLLLLPFLALGRLFKRA